MADEFAYDDFMKGYNESYKKGYKAAGIEVYKKLLEHGYSEEEARELAGVEEEDVEKYLK